MARLMRCKYCGTLQDEPPGAKICVQCGGELVWEDAVPLARGSYVTAQLALDQIAAPAGQTTERHLVLTVETPDAVPQQEQVQTASGRNTMHFVAVLDVSGSMGGSKIKAAKQAVQDAVHRLQDGDIFTLVTFASDVRCTLSAKRVDANLRRVIKSALTEIRAGGQTALCGGLEQGIQQVTQAPQSTNLVLLLSDGQANVGETDVEAVGRRALEARGKGVTVSTLGVGRDYNEALMAEIAIDGGGRFYHLSDASQIAAYLTGELGEMASLAARNAVVTLDLPAGTNLQSLSAAYPVSGHDVSLGDIPVSTSLEVILRVLLPPQPAGSRLPIEGLLRYQSPAGSALTTTLNQVTVRYDLESAFDLTDGVVKPTVRRVLGQMQAAGVLSTSKAAARSPEKARQESKVALASMRAYAQLLGKDDEAEETLAKGEEILGFMAAPAPTPEASARAKAATYGAVRRQRGSKDFDKT
jgi:Ca-activated chloride channel family protein